MIESFLSLSESVLKTIITILFNKLFESIQSKSQDPKGLIYNIVVWSKKKNNEKIKSILDSIYSDAFANKSPDRILARKFNFYESQYFVNSYEENFHVSQNRDVLTQAMLELKGKDHITLFKVVLGMLEKSLTKSNFNSKLLIILLGLNINRHHKEVSILLKQMCLTLRNNNLINAFKHIIQSIDEYQPKSCLNSEEQNLLIETIKDMLFPLTNNLYNDENAEGLWLSSISLLKEFSILQQRERNESIMFLCHRILNTINFSYSIKEQAIECYVCFYKNDYSRDFVKNLKTRSIEYFNAFEQTESISLVRKMYSAIIQIGADADENNRNHSLETSDAIKQFFNDYKNKIDRLRSENIFEGM